MSGEHFVVGSFLQWLVVREERVEQNIEPCRVARSPALGARFLGRTALRHRAKRRCGPRIDGTKKLVEATVAQPQALEESRQEIVF